MLQRVKNAGWSRNLLWMVRPNPELLQSLPVPSTLKMVQGPKIAAPPEKNTDVGISVCDDIIGLEI